MILTLMSMHFKRFYREPGVLFWALGFPIIMAWVLGMAFQHRGYEAKTVALVGPIQQNQALKSVFEHKSQWVKLEKVSESEAILGMKRGVYTLYVKEAPSGAVTYFFDDKNAEAQNTYFAVEKALSDAASPSRSTTVALKTPGQRYIDFLIPGLLAMELMSSCMWGTGYALIDMRAKRLLRRLMATPLNKGVFLLTMLLSRSVISGLELLLIYGFAWLVFGVQIQGSVPGLLALFVAGNVAFSGIAILVSSRAESSQAANGLINAVIMPMLVLSGVFFSYRHFPKMAVWVIEKLPLSMVVDGMRQIFIEGAGFSAIVGPSVALTAVGLVCFVIGLRLFKWY
ncbi:MAG: ABC transporter permease [Candidatus Margulisiibacteriota bacterium]